MGESCEAINLTNQAYCEDSRNPTMKEQTYGWYPSAKDVYRDHRFGAPSTYHIEAMYNFKNSKYYCGRTTPPTPSLQVTLPPSTPIPPSRPKSVTSGRGGSAASLQVLARSAPIYDYKPEPRLQIPTPHQCWITRLDETPYGLVQPTPIPATLLTKPPICPATSLGRSSMNTRERVRSAMIRRDRPPLPSRPVKSAGPTRPHVTSAKTVGPWTAAENARSPIEVRPSSSPAALTRASPSEEVPVLEPADLAAYEDIPEDRSPIPEADEMYDNLLEKYGWKAQIHGDPLKLKRRVIPKRYPITVKVQEPKMDSDPPKVYMESKDTFFLNTIPRRPMAFTIHRDWISETIHAKRMELQKREGMKYRYKNFSFVY